MSPSSNSEARSPKGGTKSVDFQEDEQDEYVPTQKPVNNRMKNLVPPKTTTAAAKERTYIDEEREMNRPMTKPGLPPKERPPVPTPPQKNISTPTKKPSSKKEREVQHGES